MTSGACRWGVLAVAVAMLFLAALGAAASLAVSGDDLGAGAAAVGACDSDGPAGLGGATITDYAVDGSNRVTTVTVSGLNGTCAGGMLALTLTDQLGTELGTGTANSISTPSQTVNIGGTGPDANAVADARIEVVGP
jgi:hypothetical protein